MEAQNDGEMEDLHKKIRSIRQAGPFHRYCVTVGVDECLQVTSDIYNDSQGQNRMLDTTVSFGEVMRCQQCR